MLFCSCGVLSKHLHNLFAVFVLDFLLFSHCKGICQDNALKLRIFLSIDQIVEGFFNIDCGDIVRQQHYLISVYLIGVLVKQIINIDQTAAEQTHDECACTRKRIENMNTLVIE